MAILSKEEFMNRVKERVGEDTSDEAIKFLEDMSDTFDDLDSKTKDKEDWKAKYEKNDKEWREKYRERFFNGGSDDKEEDLEYDDKTDPKTKEQERAESVSFDDLFEEKEN